MNKKQPSETAKFKKFCVPKVQSTFAKVDHHSECRGFRSAPTPNALNKHITSITIKNKI